MKPIRIPREYNLTPVRVEANSDSFDAIHIETSGDFTLTEAMDLALSITRMVQDYGKIKVEAKS